MRSEHEIYRTMRRRLLARASVLALGMAQRPRGLASGLLAAGLIGAPAPALAGETIDLAEGAEVTIQGAAAGDGLRFFKSVSGAGDVNADGIDDLIIGNHNADPNGRNSSGASYVIFGTEQGLPPIIDLATNADVVIQGAAADDHSGMSVGEAGDVNGDGIDDLIIGAYFASPSGRYSAGASYVIFGTDQGLPAVIDLATGADVVIQGATGGTPFAVQGDKSGHSVSGAGDVNGDGLDDLIIGANGANPNGRAYAGASYVVFGATDLAGTIDLADPVNGADLVIQGAAAGDGSGESVSGAGDVNDDGLDDLVIGAQQADPNGRSEAGASYVVFGATDLSGTIDLADPANGADVVIQGAAVFDLSGYSVSGAGDVNGDGIDDLLIDARTASPSGRAYAGATFVVFGATDSAGTIDLATDADLVIQGAAAGDSSGASVSGAGDVNSDGIDDLLIGARGADPNGRDDAGAGYVVFGSDGGLPATIDLADGADVVVQGAAAGNQVKNEARNVSAQGCLHAGVAGLLKSTSRRLRCQPADRRGSEANNLAVSVRNRIELSICRPWNFALHEDCGVPMERVGDEARAAPRAATTISGRNPSRFGVAGYGMATHQPCFVRTT